MTHLHPLFSLLALLAALLSAGLLVRLTGTPASSGRYQSLDGLRGYLAIFVMFHHAAIWFPHLRAGPWRTPESHLYAQFGQGSVALFFMITGFLFYSKLLQGKSIDWTRLYISRILRITPLYLFTIGMLLLIVMIQTGFTLRAPSWQIALQILSWLAFTLPGSPDINGLENTAFIVAGATWTLRYEWLFYFALPLVFAAIKGKPGRFWITVSLISVLATMLVWHPSFRYLLHFVGGGVAAYIANKTRFTEYASQTRFTFLALLCIACTVYFFPGANRFIPTVLLTIAFTIMACGNTLFGILTLPVSRYLGEISYSLYLLHGIVLYIAIDWIVGREVLAIRSAEFFWAVMIACVPVLIGLSTLTFHFIEKPALRSTERVTQILRDYLAARRSKTALRASSAE